jgi:hypothetical protein
MITQEELATTNISMRYDLSPMKNIIGDLSGLLGNFSDELIGAFYPKTVSKKANIVITELVNNAVVNSTDGDSKITLQIMINKQFLRIRVTNAAKRAQYKKVRDRIKMINSTGDLRKLLADTIRERRKDRLRGGLGLIRLAAENKFMLSAHYRAPYLVIDSQFGLGGLV